MSKKMNNRSLIIILIVLVVILVLTRLIRIPHQQSTLKTDLVSLDTSAVSTIMITTGNQTGKSIEFNKNGDTWTVSQGDVTAKEEKGAAEGILATLATVKPQRLVATSPAKWKDFELSDSAATAITFRNSSGKNLGGILVGKFTYQQPSGAYGQYGGRSFSGSSYVRIPGDKKVYAVDGFMSMMLRRSFDAWRDKTFIRTDRNDITGVTFDYPADSSFVLAYQDSAWYAGGNPADSLIASGYLNQISSSQGSSIRDHYTPSGKPLYVMTIEGKNMNPMKVECYQGENPKEYILHSGQNPGIYFVSGKSGLFDRLFKPESYFLRKKGKK